MRTTIHVFKGTSEESSWANVAWDTICFSTDVETVPADAQGWDLCEVGHGSRIGIALSVPAEELDFAASELSERGFEVEVST